MRLLTILLFLLTVSALKAQLPEVTTTDNQSILDVNNGIENEGWFLVKNAEYKCRFRNTQTGVNHAFIKLAELMIKFNGKVSNLDNSNFQKLPKKSDGTFDFDEFVKLTQNKDKDFKIRRRYALLSGSIKEIEVNNVEGNGIPFWTIRTFRGK